MMNKGDKVQIKGGVEANPEDGEYAFSIGEEEVGEVRYMVSSTKGDQFPTYCVKFPTTEKGVRRTIFCISYGLEKVP